MLTIEEIKKELDAGREVELECVDTEGFLGKESNTYLGWKKVILSLDRIIATSRSYNDNASMLKDARGTCITDSQLKYFRIKRPAPTFVELMHLVEDAQGKKLISAFYAINTPLQQEIAIHNKDGIYKWEFNKQGIKGAIDFINSLYTETFVIESEEDFGKFKPPVESIVLVNGEDIINDVMFHRNEPYFTNGGVSAVKVGFNVLKGATVTQKRSAP